MMCMYVKMDGQQKLLIKVLAAHVEDTIVITEQWAKNFDKIRGKIIK